MTIQELYQHINDSLENLYQISGQTDMDDELLGYAINHLEILLKDAGLKYTGA